MMMSKIKMGDTVRLKSGGPLMTVGEVREKDDDEVESGDAQERSAICAWFDTLYNCASAQGGNGWGQARAGEFHVDMLVKAEAPA